MKIPNPDNAVVAPEKLSGYCLNRNHEEGQHKARVFQAALGIGADDAELLRSALLAAVVEEEATPTDSDEYGQRYIDFEMTGPGGTARVRSGWIIRTREDFPRFVTCYVLDD